MPSSDWRQIGTIVELMILADPHSILDVGCGAGKYGVLAREYLEVWNGRVSPDQWTRRIDAVECFRPYLTPLHAVVYNQVFVGDVVSLLPTLPSGYDLVLLVDVLEHLTEEEGVWVLGCLAREHHNLLIATPKVVQPQGASCGNPREEHRSSWVGYDFSVLSTPVVVPHPHSLIVFAGRDAGRVWKARLTSRLAWSPPSGLGPT